MSTAKGKELRLQVSKLSRASKSAGSGSIFHPSTGLDPTSSNAYPSRGRAQVEAPEKKLTLFALRLAVFEKAATGIGTLAFVWATVVLLGGFAITLDKTDFWFITVILLIEGTRIFSRSHELEWQHQSTWSLTDASRTSFQALKTSSRSIFKTIKGMFRQQKRQDSPERTPPAILRMPTRILDVSEVSIFPYGRWFFLSSNVSRLLYWLQLASAIICVVLSLMRLIKRDFMEDSEGEKRNRNSALIIFYSLALAEASMFLVEKVYWELKVTALKLLGEVNGACELGPNGIHFTKRFFYDAYSKSVNGSIFDALKMDMVSYSMELLDSESPNEQLLGVRTLRQFAVSEKFSEDTLQKIGTSIFVIERLVEMLNWKDPMEEETRHSAAMILSKLAGKKQNSLRLAGIPGAMESISSLLYTSRVSNMHADEIGEQSVVADQENYGFWAFNELGLKILKQLSRDQDNCGKMKNTRGLLPKIIDFTYASEKLLVENSVSNSQVKSVKRALQVIEKLASTTGETGRELRKEISEVVFSFSNIRMILQHGEKRPALQKLAIGILTNLGLEEDATERIGRTGGVFRQLFNIFFKEVTNDDQKSARAAAGEALAMLALGSKENCYRMLKLDVLGKLIRALEDESLRLNAGRIIRNLCTYGGEDSYDLLRGGTAAAPVIMKAIKTNEHKLKGVMMGVAAEVFKFMTNEEADAMLEEAKVTEEDLADAIMGVFGEHRMPSIRVPGIRRYAIELAIWMMEKDGKNVRHLRERGLEEELESVRVSTAEVESFNVFSGTVGLYRHRMSMHSLVKTAFQKLQEEI